MLCGTTSLLQINLFKKQKAISVPLGRALVLHLWSSCKPLHRNVVLTGKSSEKPCKSELDPSVTRSQIVQAPAPASSSLLPGSVPHSLTRKDGFWTWKERALQGIQRRGFSWRERFVSPCSPLTSLMAWAGTMDRTWQKEKVLTRSSFYVSEQTDSTWKRPPVSEPWRAQRSTAEHRWQRTRV